MSDDAAITRTGSPTDASTTLLAWATGLYDAHGHLTPELVREAARPAASPAHGYVFNVPPGEAAEGYYLERAHKLIRQVKVVYAATPAAPARRLRLFHAVPGDENAYEYLTIDDLVRRPDKLEAAKTEARRRLRTAEEAVEDLDALASGTADRRATARALRNVGSARQALAPQ